VSNVGASGDIGDINVDGGDQRRNLMHNRKDREIGTGVARNTEPAPVAIVTRFRRRDSCSEGGKIDAAIAAGVLQKLGEFIRGKLEALRLAWLDTFAAGIHSSTGNITVACGSLACAKAHCGAMMKK